MRGDQSRPITCLSERQLVALTTDDAPMPDRWHVQTCPGCAGRAAAIGEDLRLIVGTLRSDGIAPDVRRSPRPRTWVGASAAAAVVLLALGFGLRIGIPVSAPPAAAEQRAFLESISRAMFVSQGYDRWLQGSYAAASDAARACGWGSLAMPCDVAWVADDERSGQ